MKLTMEIKTLEEGLLYTGYAYQFHPSFVALEKSS